MEDFLLVVDRQVLEGQRDVVVVLTERHGSVDVHVVISGSQQSIHLSYGFFSEYAVVGTLVPIVPTVRL